MDKYGLGAPDAVIPDFGDVDLSPGRVRLAIYTPVESKDDPSTHTDVTAALAALQAQNANAVINGGPHTVCGDPAPGKSKELHLWFHNGKEDLQVEDVLSPAQSPTNAQEGEQAPPPQSTNTSNAIPITDRNSGDSMVSAAHSAPNQQQTPTPTPGGFSFGMAAVGDHSNIDQDTPAEQAAARAAAEARLDDYDDHNKKPKSLYLAIVLVNPFHEVAAKNSEDAASAAGDADAPELLAVLRDELQRAGSKIHLGEVLKPPKGMLEYQPSNLNGYQATQFAPATYMRDDDFLEHRSIFENDAESLKKPTHFEKLLGMLVRFKRRGLRFEPSGMVEECAAALPGEPWNFLSGFRLVPEKMWTSVDFDECYVRLHADKKTLLEFAGKQKRTLRGNPLSFLGGGGATYTPELEEELAHSVKRFLYHFGDQVPEHLDYCRGKKDPETGDWVPWGFDLSLPQKSRLALRILRTSWQFGGVGMQLDEISKADDGFVKNYFPMHNQAFIGQYELDKWGSICSLFNPCEVLRDREPELVAYAGESVAIYFSWTRSFCYMLFLPGLVGVAASVLQWIDYYPSIVAGLYSGFFILWGAFWQRQWARSEAEFALRWGQDIESETALVRDEFYYISKQPVYVDTLLSEKFGYPLTLQRLPDGTLVNLHYPNSRRMAIRYLLSWPLLMLYAAAMVSGLLYTEFFRFDNKHNATIRIGASIISSLITTVFSSTSTSVIALCNSLENTRTDEEHQFETDQKSFIFQAVATYFSVFTIVFFPGLTNDQRKENLTTQMVTQILVLPLVLNLVEMIMPFFNTELRRRTDSLGSALRGLCSMVCCCGCCPSCKYVEADIDNANENVLTPEQRGALSVHREATLEKYASTSGDYLELTLMFGYMLLFASVLPALGMAVFINTVVEYRVDAWKLRHHHQRTVHKIARNIGAWSNIFWGLIAVAVLTNAYWVTLIVETVADSGLTATEKQLHQYFAYLQYFVLLAIMVVVMLRPATSDETLKARVKLQLLQDRVIQLHMQKQLNMSKEELAAEKAAAARAIQQTVDGEAPAPEEEDGSGCC